MLSPHGHIEVLAISKGGEFIRMYLHREGSNYVYCDLPSAYARRVTLPHAEVFETREIVVENAFSPIENDYLSALRLLRANSRDNSPPILTAFTELFLAAHGFYYPGLKELTQIE